MSYDTATLTLTASPLLMSDCKDIGCIAFVLKAGTIPPMSRHTKEQLEKAELRLILSSGLLAKSPNLEKLLTYICEKHWEGKSDQLKEYNLGVEALGRPTDFDPAANAIVRVEVHRLREKLKRCYENGGANHRVAIILPPGHYVPQFICKQADVSTQVDQETGANQL
jgi:hypothetical protein